VRAALYRYAALPGSAAKIFFEQHLLKLIQNWRKGVAKFIWLARTKKMLKNKFTFWSGLDIRTSPFAQKRRRNYD
jgi:hypothetical protein